MIKQPETFPLILRKEVKTNILLRKWTYVGKETENLENNTHKQKIRTTKCYVRQESYYLRWEWSKKQKLYDRTFQMGARTHT